MSALKRVEDSVGVVDSWPSYMILHMFASVPDVRVMKQVAAFMFGNGIDVETATECYVQCRGREYMQMIREALTRRYYKWNRASRQSHLAEYYNMREGCELDKWEGPET